MVLAAEAQEDAEEVEAAQNAASSSSRSRNRRIDFTAEADALVLSECRAAPGPTYTATAGSRAVPCAHEWYQKGGK